VECPEACQAGWVAWEEWEEWEERTSNKPSPFFSLLKDSL
jgi:hypothetical protein